MRTHAIDTRALAYGLGAIGLGAVGIAFASFALQWQPVPEALKGNATLATLSGLILIAGGALALLRRTGRIGGAVLAGFYGLWVVALHVPVVAAKPDVGSLLGLAELLALAAAGAQIALPPAGAGAPGWFRLPRVAFGLSAIVFGISHFVYAQFTAAMVPGWIGASLFWAYATGLGHLAAGAAILTGIRARLAATVLAAMAASFVLLLHVPRVAAAPGSQLEWTMLCVALSITGAAWVMRGAGR